MKRDKEGGINRGRKGVKPGYFERRRRLWTTSKIGSGLVFGKQKEKTISSFIFSLLKQSDCLF